jgi:hypothetical protein
MTQLSEAEIRQAKIREIRRKIIGAGIMSYLKESQENNVHIRLEPPKEE